MKDRIYSLDKLKAIAAILVCFQHSTNIIGISHEYILGLSKIAVPLFMMITGFMYIDTVNKNHEKKQLVKFFKIGIEMFVIWFCIDALISILKGNFLNFVQSLISFDSIAHFLLCNDPIIADHSWYIWSMIYVLAFYAIVSPIKKNFILQLIIVICSISAQLLLGKYSYILGSTHFDYFWARSAWTVSFTYFTIGIWVRKYIINKQISSINIYLCIFFSIILYTVEFLYLRSLNIKNPGYMFSIILLSTSVFIFCLYLKQNKPSFLSNIGIQYSLYIYILHPLFVRIEAKYVDLHSVGSYIGFITVVCLSLFLAIIYEKIKLYILKIKW